MPPFAPPPGFMPPPPAAFPSFAGSPAVAPPPAAATPPFQPGPAGLPVRPPFPPPVPAPAVASPSSNPPAAHVPPAPTSAPISATVLPPKDGVMWPDAEASPVSRVTSAKHPFATLIALLFLRSFRLRNEHYSQNTDTRLRLLQIVCRHPVFRRGLNRCRKMGDRPRKASLPGSGKQQPTFWINDEVYFGEESIRCGRCQVTSLYA